MTPDEIRKACEKIKVRLDELFDVDNGYLDAHYEKEKSQLYRIRDLAIEASIKRSEDGNQE